MRKIYFVMVVAAAMLMCIPASAQVQFGLKGGLNLTSMSVKNFGEKVTDSDNRQGFYIGPTVKFSLLDVGFGVDASVLYDQRSGRLEDDADQNSVSLTQKQIAIPVNLRYAFGLGSTANIFLFAGPQFGFNVGGDKDLTAASTWKWKNSNFSVNVGLGVTVFSHLQVNANYNIACGKTGEASVANVAEGLGNLHARYNAWQIGLAYFF